MFKVVRVPAAVSAGKIVGSISFFAFASIIPRLNVGDPTTTIVGGEEEEDTDCCVTVSEVVLSALVLSFVLVPLTSAPVWTVEEDTVLDGSTSTITPVAIADPLLLISIFNGLTTPAFAVTIFDKPGNTPRGVVLEEDVITAAVLRITLPLSRNGISRVVDLVSPSSCSATLK